MIGCGSRRKRLVAARRASPDRRSNADTAKPAARCSGSPVLLYRPRFFGLHHERNPAEVGTPASPGNWLPTGQHALRARGSGQRPALAVLAADERIGLGGVEAQASFRRPTRSSGRPGRRRCPGGSPPSASRRTRSSSRSTRRSWRRRPTRPSGPASPGSTARGIEVAEPVLGQEHVLPVAGQQHPLGADEQDAVLERRKSRPETYLQSGRADLIFSAKSPGSLSVGFSSPMASLALRSKRHATGSDPRGSAFSPCFKDSPAFRATPPLDPSVSINIIRGRKSTGNRPTSWGPDRGRFTLPALLPRTHRHAPPPL